MQAMHNPVSKHQAPGKHRIQVQWIQISGEFGEGKLIVRRKYTLGHI
ncbi:hypothetical protein D1AOALGA4SA_3507 [Olavius algarvensis Delta 1 endosymbiont]|nr:hypothetical protein D1AOALGA4SA_3507 [Olavius algarvensis Delta 1 endosymbiont]